jgi:hypothetical protein
VAGPTKDSLPFGPRNAREEASEVVGKAFDVRVLEPSPPAVKDGDFFADDPPARGTGSTGRRVLGPTSAADVQWHQLADEQPELAGWCSERWLGPWATLDPLPAGYAATKEGLRSIACYVMAPARKAATGRIGLRWTFGGFGTPFFDSDVQLRVVGGRLVRQEAGDAISAPIETLSGAAAVARVRLDPDPGVGSDLPLYDPRAPLALDAAASLWLGDWYGFAASVLEEVRASLAGHASVSRLQVWPEHFDASVTVEGGARGGVNLGCSPGDSFDSAPYVYVGPRDHEGLEGSFWNAPFGAVLDHADIVASADQRGDALRFLREGLDRVGIPGEA